MPAELEACVAKKKRLKGVDNPFALCRHILGSDADIYRRRKKRKKSKRKPKRND